MAKSVIGRKLLLLTITLSTVFGAMLSIPDKGIVVAGLLRGESFYRCRPTSYWSNRILNGPIPYSPGYVVSWDPSTYVPASSIDQVKKSLGMKYTVTPYHYPLRDHDPSAIPVLIELLRDRNSWVRMYAVETLGDFGPKASDAIPVLKELLNDDEIGGFGITVAERAAEALKHIESKEEEAPWIFPK
jgi:HEAT repeats